MRAPPDRRSARNLGNNRTARNTAGRHSTIRHGAIESAIAARTTANRAHVRVVMSTVYGEVGGVADVRVAVCGRVNAYGDPDEETVYVVVFWITSHFYSKFPQSRALTEGILIDSSPSFILSHLSHSSIPITSHHSSLFAASSINSHQNRIYHSVSSNQAGSASGIRALSRGANAAWLPPVISRTFLGVTSWAVVMCRDQLCHRQHVNLKVWGSK
ncbi:hypothetical protein V2W45_1407871 [Cenococcum geophilum]